MKIKFQTVYFLIGLTVGSWGLSSLNAMAVDRHSEVAVTAKKEVILGHRIGPNGQEMLVVR